MPTAHSFGLGSAQCEALRERVLDAARCLVSRRGPNVTLSEIAHHAQKPADTSQERSIHDDAIVASLLEQRLGDLVEVVQAADPPHRAETSATWTQAVREILSGQLDGSALSLRDAARTLSVSVRTLQRRLDEEGTNWRTEIDTARKERAGRLLQQGATAHVTAARVGFSGSRALRRALRRWEQEQD
jgi:AraC-like DNA-binding protein